MATALQITANRQNAEQSCGPKTPEGKAISSLNHRSHGFTGHFAVLPWESAEDFATLLADLRAQHAPENITEQAYVDQMAENLWLRRRAQTLQNGCLNPETPTVDDEKRFALYLRYQTTADRGFDRCVNQLLKLRNEKRKAEIGFESKKRQADAAEAKAAAAAAAEEEKIRAKKAHDAQIYREIQAKLAMYGPQPGATFAMPRPATPAKLTDEEDNQPNAA